jgi:flagellar protein FlgJ
MIDPSTAQTVYNDMGALADLRTRAQSNPNDAVDEVAQQFEALFIQMMLKSMRDAVEEGGLFDSHQLETYEQMADQQLALDMASDGGIGLADAMIIQLSRAQNTVDASENNQKSLASEGLPLQPLEPANTGKALSAQERKAFSLYRDAAAETLDQRDVPNGPTSSKALTIERY